MVRVEKIGQLKRQEVGVLQACPVHRIIKGILSMSQFELNRIKFLASEQKNSEILFFQMIYS